MSPLGHSRMGRTGGRFGHVRCVPESGSRHQDNGVRRTARPQEPIAGHDRSADGRRKQHRHMLAMPLVPCGDQPLCVLNYLPPQRPPRLGFSCRGCSAFALYPALVEAHPRMVAGFPARSISLTPSPPVVDNADSHTNPCGTRSRCRSLATLQFVEAKRPVLSGWAFLWTAPTVRQEVGWSSSKVRAPVC